MRAWAIELAERLAADWAQVDKHSIFHLIALLARGPRIITVGYNRSKSKHTGNLHAEHDALKTAQAFRGKKATGGELYVCRIRANGTLAIAKPCKACLKLIKLAGIKKVYFTNRDGNWEQLR